MGQKTFQVYYFIEFNVNWEVYQFKWLGIKINTEKKQWPEDDLEEDYFCRERYQLYLDTLATQHEDVAELMWAYVSSFWKNQFEGKDEYLQSIKYNLDSWDFYDLTI